MILGAQSAFGGMSSIIFMVLIFGLMYFFMIRPQRKQQKERQDMMNQLHVGDKVVTIGRLHGVVDSIDDTKKTVTLDCDGIYLVFDRMAIMRVEPKETATNETVQATTTTDVPDSETEVKDSDTTADSDETTK